MLERQTVKTLLDLLSVNYSAKSSTAALTNKLNKAVSLGNIKIPTKKSR